MALFKILPAKIGKESNNKKAVTKMAQTKRGSSFKGKDFKLKIVLMKFIAPNIEEIPERCRDNIAKSTLPPEWNDLLDKGGYKVQPVPGPDSI